MDDWENINNYFLRQETSEYYTTVLKFYKFLSFLVLQNQLDSHVHFFLYRKITSHVVVVQSPSCVRLFVTLWTAAHQASLSFTISQSLLKLMSTELAMPSNRFILCCPLLLLPSTLPSIRVFSNEMALGQSIRASVSASVLAVNIQGWFPLGWTGWISLQSKGLSRAFSSIIV